MEIYVVQAGDTIDKIANRYRITVAKLINDNDLTNPNNLVPGEALIILHPSQIYTVKSGDTLQTVAGVHNISVGELLRNNPTISDRGSIYPGELLTINYNRTSRVSTHGYSNTFINRNVLKKTLPYLTYLSIFNYRTVKNGELSGSNDDIDMIKLAKDFGVIPLLLLTTISVQGDVDIEITYEVIINEEVQNKLIENVLKVLKEKGYYGINISAQYVNIQNQPFFYNYVKKVSDRLQQEGYMVIITINPKIDKINNEVTYEKVNYSNIVNLVDSAIFLQYKWGINISPPSPVTSISNLKVFLDDILPNIPKEKVFTSITTLGYIWELPFLTGFSRSNSLKIDSVINLARDVGATIEFDDSSQTPYFTYKDLSQGGVEYIVWFINAITINSLLSLSLQKGISGTGVWNVMTYYSHLWHVINSQYKIIKLLNEL